MKKLSIILLALLLVFSLTACGGEEKPVGEVSDIAEGGEQELETPDTEEPANPTLGVTVKDDRVVSTVDDGLGSITVTEYIYKDGAVADVLMTMVCADETTAKALYDTYNDGESAQYADRIFTEIKLDGNNVIFVYNDDYKSAFADISMEQLAETLGMAEGLSQ